MDAVGFDLDYTLLDQDAFLRSFFEAVAGDLGRRLGMGRGTVLEALGDTLDRLTPAHPALFDQALGRLGVGDARLVAELVDRYHRHRPPVRPYPGVPAILDRLRAAGLRLFLVTDGHPATQRFKVTALGLAARFEQVVFTGDYPAPLHKPSPYPFRLACARLGLPPQRCAYVGDNPACDFQAPRRLGMWTVGVATGPFARGPAEPGQVPHRRIASLADLEPCLAEVRGGQP